MIRCLAVIAIIGIGTEAFSQPGKAPANAPESKPDSSVVEQRLYSNGLPRVETLLKSTLEHHPDVLLARSKLQAAEAELRQAEMKAMKELMLARGLWEAANQNVIALRNKAGKSEELRVELSSLAAIEWELKFMTGARADSEIIAKPLVEASNSENSFSGNANPFVLESAYPRPERFDAIKDSLKKVLTINFHSMPLNDAMQFLSEGSGLKILLDEELLTESGFPVEGLVTCDLGDLELYSAIQAIEDLYRPLRFVVRDYGILLTTDRRQLSKMISVWDFMTLDENELREKLKHQNRDENRRKK